MLFHFSHFPFLPPPLSPFSKAFIFLPPELFLLDHTQIPSIPLPSFFPFSLSLSLSFLYFLTLILPWAPVNSDWFACHSLLDSLSFCFPLPAPSLLPSVVDILQEVVIPFSQHSPIIHSFTGDLLGLARMHE